MGVGKYKHGSLVMGVGECKHGCLVMGVGKYVPSVWYVVMVLFNISQSLKWTCFRSHRKFLGTR